MMFPSNTIPRQVPRSRVASRALWFLPSVILIGDLAYDASVTGPLFEAARPGLRLAGFADRPRARAEAIALLHRAPILILLADAGAGMAMDPIGMVRRTLLADFCGIVLCLTGPAS